MRELLHRRYRDLHKGQKLIAINSQTQDKETTTRVRKSFLYRVTRVQDKNVVANAPEIYIRKSFDTEQRKEKFTFQIKGNFYTTNGGIVVRVYFHHCLNVQISWKDFYPIPQEVSGSDPV